MEIPIEPMELPESVDDLEFQDTFDHENEEQLMIQGEDSHSNSHITNEEHANHKIWSLKFYQYYFNVTTSQILSRLKQVILLQSIKCL